MRIDATKEEFEALLDLVYLGNTVINGLRSQEERIPSYHAIEQELFKMCQSFGCQNKAEYDKEFKEYMPTYEYEESGINEYIDAYDTKVFWEELVMRLARRDALNYVGDVDQDMTKAQLKEMQLKLEEQYEEEIEEHGVSRLKIIKLTTDTE